MSNKNCVVKLVNGRVYFLGNDRFNVGEPVLVDQLIAEKLQVIVDHLPIANGGFVAREKFEVVPFDTSEEASEYFESLKNEEANHKIQRDSDKQPIATVGARESVPTTSRRVGRPAVSKK